MLGDHWVRQPRLHHSCSATDKSTRCCQAGSWTMQMWSHFIPQEVRCQAHPLDILKGCVCCQWWIPPASKTWPYSSYHKGWTGLVQGIGQCPPHRWTSGVVMCRLRPEARSRAKPGQKKPSQAGPCALAWGGFWPGLWFLKAKAAGLSPGFCRYIFVYFVYQICFPKKENWPKLTENALKFWRKILQTPGIVCRSFKIINLTLNFQFRALLTLLIEF